MKTVKILLDGVHSTSTTKHALGEIVSLPDDIAAALIMLKRAVSVEGSAFKIEEAKEAADEDQLERQRQVTKASAERNMELHDALPAQVRAAVHEHDFNRVLPAYFEQLKRDADQIKDADPDIEAIAESTDDDPLSAVDKMAKDAVPKRKRGRPRKVRDGENPV